MSNWPPFDLPLKAFGIEVAVPTGMRGPSARSLRWRWRLVVLYPDRFCSYCGERKRLTIDHVRPVADGGLDDLSNYVPACSDCNSAKGDKSLLMFLLKRAA